MNRSAHVQIINKNLKYMNILKKLFKNIPEILCINHKVFFEVVYRFTIWFHYRQTS
jgi:hypothetical protein